MKPRWLIAAVAAAALVFLVAGWATSAEPPKPAPTFTVAGLAVEDGLLVVKFRATYPPGMSGAWDPEAVKAAVARLVTVLDGKWTWSVYTPELRGGGPIPPPPPPPPPINKAAFLYIIHESKDDTPIQAAVWNSKLLADTVKSLDMQMGTYDQDQGVKVYPNATKRAQAKGLPAAVFLDKAGAVIAVEALPVTVDAMVALTRKHGGGK